VVLDNVHPIYKQIAYTPEGEPKKISKRNERLSREV